MRNIKRKVTGNIAYKNEDIINDPIINETNELHSWFINFL